MRQWIRSAILSALLAGGAAPASAQMAEGCADLSTQSGQNRCGGEAYRQADAGLQSAYDRLRASYGAEEKRRLRDAQRAWIGYRDAWCAFETMSVEGGSMHPSVLAGCLTRMTEEQTRQIVYQLTCEVDTNCAGGGR